MHTLRRSVLAVAIALGGAALSLPATARDVAWSVSVGGPGYAINAGQSGFGPGWRHGHHPVARPVVIYPAGYRPVGYRSVVVAPPVWVAPRPVYYAPRPVYYAPRPVYYAPQPVYYAPRPYVTVNTFPHGGWDY